MSKYLAYLFITFSLTGIPLLNAQNLRSELNRYSLLNDKQMIYSSARWAHSDQSLGVQGNFSSGLKRIIGEIRNSSSEPTSIGQEVRILETLTRNLNSEKFVSLDGVIRVKLPALKTRDFDFSSSLFTKVHAGTSFSVDGQSFALDPTAQVYLLKKIKIGASVDILDQRGLTENRELERSLRLSLYQMQKSDFLESLAISEIASRGNLIEIDDVTQDEVTYNLDIIFDQTHKAFKWRVGVSEIHLSEKTSKERRTEYARYPLFFGEFTYTDFNPTRYITYKPFVGAHYRSHYSLVDSFYLGVHSLFHRRDVPVRVTGLIDNQSLYFMPSLNMRYFRFGYSLKLPYRNPKDKLWVSAVHGVELAIPF